MAVSPPRSDCQSMRGARGDAHEKEWPGAMMPALPRGRLESDARLLLDESHLVPGPGEEVRGRHADDTAAEHERLHADQLTRRAGIRRGAGRRDRRGTG